MKHKKLKRTTEQSTARQEELAKRLSNLRSQLTKTEKRLTKATERAERWRTEAKSQRKSAVRAGARADALQEELGAASAALKALHAGAPRSEAAISGRPVTEQSASDGGGVPDETWSVVQLRAEARARGLVGMSNKPKAQLLAALS